MNKHSISRLAAVVTLGAACAMPVMAQDSSTTTTTPSNDSQSTATQTMGAGPDSMDTRGDNDRDMGWIGLLGLVGLLGLRGRHHHHDDRMEHRHATTAR
ncbi:MAG TPA: WGxxGxxG family protein [Ramlibacter sp.]|uniref:WGxxGxxG family protein n=1 Tax=Ramlibacter sp. TaxID=1917967 RepID=UPI002D7EE0C1|nr:WGxxGxxG family protein [Ramlibacter sp.]HET8746420.1 WGxxGxxG family protein [Ramlibacter sp.]